MDEKRTRIMGLDIGHKRTGIALSDESCTISSPLTVLPMQNRKEFFSELAKLVEENAVAEVVVGLPLNQWGEEGNDAEKMQKIIALLRERLSVPVIEWDERFTTVQAERSLLEADLSRKRRKEVIDKIAAAILLQSFLDSRKFQGEAKWDSEE